MRMTKEQAKARKKKKEEEWSAELVRLQIRQNQCEHNQIRERNNQKNVALLEEVHRKILGGEFRAWYEATTGEPVAEFIDVYVISPKEFLERYDGNRGSQLDWTREAIERIVESNPWTNPETKSFWAEKIRDASSTKERRTILLRLATPRWASREKVEEIYRERETMVSITGVPHDVDHIIPIVHTDVCGLHCEFNLRVIPANENRSKSNLFNGTIPRGRYQKTAGLDK